MENGSDGSKKRSKHVGCRRGITAPESEVGRRKVSAPATHAGFLPMPSAEVLYQFRGLQLHVGTRGEEGHGLGLCGLSPLEALYYSGGTSPDGNAGATSAIFWAAWVCPMW